MAIFLTVSCIKPNASVNLQGKQNISKLPYDDALVYVSDVNGDSEYRIYDLNAYSALTKYAPEMKYSGEYYVGEGEKMNFELKAAATATGNTLTVKKNTDNSLVYLDFKNINAKSFTVDDGFTTHTYNFNEEETYSINLHSDCVVTINGGNADVEYKEVLRDYKPLIPSEFENDTEKLHFNLWLTGEFHL